MKTQNRRILFPLAGAVLGMLAGASFGIGKGIAASAAFFGFVGFGLVERSALEGGDARGETAGER